MKMMTGPLALFAVLASVSFVSAQTVTPSIPSTANPSVDQTVKDVLPQQNPEEAALPSIVIEFPTQQAPANSGTLNFVLNDVVVDGAEMLPPDAIRAVYSDLIGRRITLLEAFGILDRVQAAHRDAGFVFTRVIAPPQTIDGGVFKVQVVEAVIGEVIIEEPDGPVGKVLPLVEKIAGRLTGLENPTLAELERTLLLLNDIPGITQATAVPRPGTGLGAVDLFINVVRDPFSGVFFADNRQSPVLGPGIVGVSASLNSWSSAGDTTTLSFFSTAGDRVDDFLERNIVQIEHQRFLGANGTTLNLRGLVSRNTPGDLLEDLDIDGRQINVEAYVEHPFIRTRPLSVWGAAGFEVQEGVSDTGGGQSRIFDDSLRVAYLGGRLLQRDKYGYTRADAEVRQGFDVFGANTQDDADERLSRSDGRAEFTLFRGSIERELVIPNTDNRLSVYGSALAQYSLDPLLSSEEFAVGGQQIGRAYDPSEFTGDSGYGALWELRYQVQFEAEGIPIGAQFYGYGDIAEVHNRGDVIPDENIKSYGGGIRLSLPHDIGISGEVAIPTSRLQRNNEEKPRFFFNLVKRF